MKHSPQEYTKRILFSRLRILTNYGFYGMMLMHMNFGLDMEAETAYTNGDKICFGPKFLDEISDSELDFVMMHEIMHVALNHCHRGLQYNQELFNIACDIVVNSNILKSRGMNLSSITLKKYGEAMHKIHGKEGYLYTAEEVYEMLLNDVKNSSKDLGEGFDDHSKWDKVENKDKIDEVNAQIVSIAKAEQKALDNGKPGVGSTPFGVERIVMELTDPTIDWRQILNDFIQMDITDYSFMPPDRRYEGPFYMPDFNEPEEREIELLFMVDTSGSMSDDLIAKVYSEIRGAILQFDGKLKGKVGFFDAAVYEPKPFESVSDLLEIKPKGGGGTSFSKVFKYVLELEEKPAFLVMLTDGYDTFPPENAKGDIPLLWILTSKDVKPPYGIVARIKNEKEKNQ